MKHNPVAIEYGDLMDRIAEEEHSTLEEQPRPEPPLPHASWYVATWDEQIQHPRYNGECTYHGPMNKQEAMEYRDGVVQYGQRCFKE